MPTEAKNIMQKISEENLDKKFQIKNFLADILRSKNAEIEQWFAEKYSQNKPFFYSSVDVRHSGYKIVPVDTNLFPGGFNILSEAQTQNAVTQAKQYIATHYSSAKNILIIPESHTRNLYYLENVATIRDILLQAGFNVQVTNLEITEPTTLQTIKGRDLQLQVLQRTENKLHTNNFTPDLILVNNDLSAGLPKIMEDISQPMIPPVELGWFRRRKTGHFESYNLITREFGRKFGIDSWLISTIFEKCSDINFREKEGLNCVAAHTQSVLDKIALKYQQYGITEQPYVFIKADSSTYGMGIMVVKSVDEIFEINKKERHSMHTVKDGQINSEVVIQEGVPTIDVVNGNAAEPLIYLVGGNAVGCTYRVNENQDKFGNLNSKGMVFENLKCQEEKSEINCPVQSLIARLATLAAMRECYESNWDI